MVWEIGSVWFAVQVQLKSSGENPAKELYMSKEAKARIKINELLKEASWKLLRVYEAKVIEV